MTILWAVLGLFAALDPFGRVRQAPGATRRSAIVAAGVVIAVVVVLELVADPLLGRLDVSAPTMVIAAGLVLIVVSSVRLVETSGLFGQGHGVVTAGEGEETGSRSGVVPLAFPLLLTPVVGVVTIAGGATLSAGATSLAAVPALLVWVGATQVRSDAVLRLAGAAVAVLGIVVGVVFAVDGVFTL